METQLGLQDWKEIFILKLDPSGGTSTPTSHSTQDAPFRTAPADELKIVRDGGSPQSVTAVKGAPRFLLGFSQLHPAPAPPCSFFSQNKALTLLKSAPHPGSYSLPPSLFCHSFREKSIFLCVFFEALLYHKLFQNCSSLPSQQLCRGPASLTALPAAACSQGPWGHHQVSTSPTVLL